MLNGERESMENSVSDRIELANTQVKTGESRGRTFEFNNCMVRFVSCVFEERE